MAILYFAEGSVKNQFSFPALAFFIFIQTFIKVVWVSDGNATWNWGSPCLNAPSTSAGRVKRVATFGREYFVGQWGTWVAWTIKCITTLDCSSTVRCRRRLQGRAERVPHPRARRGWLLRRGGARHPHPHRDHHHGDAHAERARREGQAHPRAHVRRTEALQLPRGIRRALRREGGHQGAVRHRPGRVAEVQAHRRTRSQAVSEFLH